MRNFFFRAKDEKNKIIRDYIKASNFSEAAVILERRGYIVLEIKEETVLQQIEAEHISIKNKSFTFSMQEKKEFFTSFYFLYKSGLSILEIFKSMMKSTHNTNIKWLCIEIIKKVEKGQSLREAMTHYKNALGLAYTTLITAGEESGTLEDVLSNIIKHITKEEALKQHIISSVTYPVVIMFFAIAVYLFFEFFVLKIFKSIAEGDYVNTMPILAGAIIKIIVIFAIIFGILFYIFKNKILMQKILNFILKIGIFYRLIKNYYFTNFFFVLSLAYAAGVSAAESIIIANMVINIKNINVKIQKAETMIEKGCEIATAFMIAGVFSDYAISQISAGEKAGELEKIFKTVAFDYEKKFDNSIKIITKLIEPVFILFAGILVAIVASKAYKGYFNSLFSMF